MNTGLKLALYVSFILGGLVFGYRSYEIYRSIAAAVSTRFDQAEAEPVTNPAEPSTNATSPDGATNQTTTNALAATPTNSPVLTNAAATVANPPPAGGTPSARAIRAEKRSRLGLHGALCFACLVGFGVMLGHDVADFFAQRANKALFNEDAKTHDPEYDLAEQEWAKGNYLESVRLMRDYLKTHPREQGVALRIAEIYEVNLNNPLAAALEYEEVLKTKLPPERWGWAVIHLANIYSGKLEQTERAVEWLRYLAAKHPETAAAEKARQRLAAYDAAGQAPSGETLTPEEQNPPAPG